MERLIRQMQWMGIDTELNRWLYSKNSNSLLTNASEASEHEIQTKKCKLYELQTEVLDKLFAAVDTIPMEILGKMPGFDAEIYQRFKIYSKRVNAKIRQMDRKLLARQEPPLNENPEDNFQPSQIRDVVDDFYDPPFSPPVSRSANTFQQKKPLSACLGSAVSQLQQESKKPTATVTSSSAQNRSLVDNASEEVLDMDMQEFLAAYGDDSEEFFANDANKNNEEENSQEFNFPEFDAGGVASEAALLESNSSNMLQLIGNVSNDGANREFNTLAHPHCQQMLHIFRTKFGLHLFRPNQLSAMNAVILGHDCFILMPTGGGKSLCYQLPALMADGLTVVVSPLRSLIIDQTQKLLSLDIPAMYLTGDLSDSEQNLVYRKLREQNCELRLLYVTPEKLSLSVKFTDTLQFLYRHGKLARFVIDEVHCVSQWGHDFRPDYKKLSMLRQKFPEVPLMALTATATQRVRSDILHQLDIKSPKWFISGFNRPNLRYSVMPKKAKSMCNQITEIIKKKFPKDCGIVYCISRKDCDDLADALTKNGLKALSYHAGLPDKVRIDRQSQWISEKVKIICATIAFGMGIDKLNVRFVIHGAIPKSIEGYYQESGRAGRDGETADCILLYNYGDVYRYRNMFERSENTNPEALKTHMENLNRMVHFCDNLADCRRALQLNYFGEQFDRRACIANKETMCDNCQTYDQFVELDVTEHAVNLLKLIQMLNGARKNCVTMLQVVDIYKGCDVSQIAYKLADGYFDYHGLGNEMTKYEIERLLHILVVHDYLCENMEPNNGIVCAYVAPGKLADQLLHGDNVQICLQKKAAKKPAEDKSKNNSTSTEQLSAVTNVALKDIEQRCYEELMGTINGIAGALDVSANSIMNMVALRKMSQDLPTTQTAMMKIPHVTKANFEKYGKSLLDITKKYAKEKEKLLEEEGDIQSAYQDFESEEEEAPTNYNNAAGKRRRGNGGQPNKRFRANNSNQSTASSRANFNAGSASKTNGRGRGGNGRGRGGGGGGGSRGPGLCELTKNGTLDAFLNK